MTLILEKKLQKFAHFGIVFDDQDFAGTLDVFCRSVVAAVEIAQPSRRRTARRLADFDGKDRAFVRERAGAHRVAKEFAQTLHDRQAEAEAAAHVARVDFEPVIVLENRLKRFARDADSGVPNLDAHYSGAPPATE